MKQETIESMLQESQEFEEGDIKEAAKVVVGFVDCVRNSIDTLPTYAEINKSWGIS